MLYNHQLYSLIQLLFSTLCACERILSLDMFIAYSAEKTEKLKRLGVIVLLGSSLDFISAAALLFSAG